MGWPLGEAWGGVTLVPTPCGGKSALLCLWLVWANDRSLCASGQRCKLVKILNIISAQPPVLVLSITSLAAHVGKLRYRAFDSPLKITESVAKALGCWFPNLHS